MLYYILLYILLYVLLYIIFFIFYICSPLAADTWILGNLEREGGSKGESGRIGNASLLHMRTRICLKTDFYKISNLIFQMTEGEILWKFSENTFYDFVLSPSNVTSSPTTHLVIRELSIRFILSLAFCKLDSY